MPLRLYIDRLERFSVQCGATVVRNSLAGEVLGRVEGRRIVLRSGLSLEQRLLTLVHELTHLIAHYNVNPRLNRTVCEYEAEAVEKWLGVELKVSPYAQAGLDVASLTDDLLAGSVIRVRWAAATLLRVARDGAAENERLQA
jgi:IrrE N-terminal-like domain